MFSGDTVLSLAANGTDTEADNIKTFMVNGQAKQNITPLVFGCWKTIDQSIELA
jgi:hypothetical protein